MIDELAYGDIFTSDNNNKTCITTMGIMRSPLKPLNPKYTLESDLKTLQTILMNKKNKIIDEKSDSVSDSDKKQWNDYII
jgi:hypothetical protein